MLKVYKVQQTVTLQMESEVVAHSKAEAKRLLEEGEGDFSDYESTSTATVKVLYEMVDEPVYPFLPRG
ncbi:MAG: hypothetical protein CL755_12495 [Chloroflexi bacterium]|nr:hypothetical protein [Chloroflexota bacterium]|tara:strand:+ start:7982 stop:8185 length:204 start_codon:yes stop_codon:yes gene_type:complete